MQTIVGWLVTALLDWLAKFFAAHIAAYEKDVAAKAASKEQATAETKKASELKPDSSGKDVSGAIDDTLKHL